MPTSYESFMDATRWGWRPYTETQWGLHVGSIPYPIIVVEAAEGAGCHWRWNVPNQPNRCDHECPTLAACFDDAEASVAQAIVMWLRTRPVPRWVAQ